jgi:flagellar protein FlaG
VAEAVSNLNDYVQVIRRELQFRVDKETGQTVVTVLDSETREVIRQIPREEVLALARHLGREKGLLFSADI